METTTRMLVATSAVGLLALLAMVALWGAVDTDACASSSLELAHCQAAIDAP
jgi:hypothetical protein